jgi:hypothetical protein
MDVARQLLLAVVAVIVVSTAAKPRDEIAFGKNGTAHLGSAISAFAREYKLDGPTLKKLLDKDRDLGVDKKNKKLVYACSTLPPNVSVNVRSTRSTKHGRHLHEDSDSEHDHHHDHASLLKMLDLPSAGASGAGRHLLQLTQANLVDPTPSALPVTSTGVPLLHSRPGAQRKIYLDFDGHTTRCFLPHTSTGCCVGCCSALLMLQWSPNLQSTIYTHALLTHPGASITCHEQAVSIKACCIRSHHPD